VRGAGADVKPKIGISKCSKIEDYVESVRRAGGEPVVLDWESVSAEEAGADLDGLVLTGGPDVSPERYGESPHSRTYLADPKRDAFEFALVARALAAETPLLAICRGMQVLNVAAGGTLVQDIPSEQPAAEAHQVNEPKNAPAHLVKLELGSTVARLLGKTEAIVNSRHHQAVRAPGQGLVVTATAPDGIVEGIEKPDAPFCVGVEWHPENFVESGEFLPLFEGLVKAAKGGA
jgi:putative glutamine amidotransferase